MSSRPTSTRTTRVSHGDKRRIDRIEQPRPWPQDAAPPRTSRESFTSHHPTSTTRNDETKRTNGTKKISPVAIVRVDVRSRVASRSVRTRRVAPVGHPVEDSRRSSRMGGSPIRPRARVRALERRVASRCDAMRNITHRSVPVVLFVESCFVCGRAYRDATG